MCWFALCGLLAAPGCADEADSGDGMETGSDGGQEDDTGDQDSDGAAAMGEGAIRGTFVFLDGSETDLEVSTSVQRLEFGGVVQFSCGGSDLEAGLSLGVTWREDTTAGTHVPSLSDGPGFIAAWPKADGQGIRATTPSDGELTFESIGTQPGDVVEGTARALLHPEVDDPDDRVSEIVEIEFRCVVSDAE